MRFLGRLLGAGRKRQGGEAPRREAHAPSGTGWADFGGKVCGFDLGNCPYVTRNGERIPVLDGQNWRKAVDDCLSLERFFLEARDYDKDFPAMLRVSFHDFVLPKVTLHGPTPTGKAPKYPLSVNLAAEEPVPETPGLDFFLNAPKAERDRYEAEANRPKDAIYATLCYLPDGSVGKADFYFWKENVCFGARIRRKGGLYLAQSSRKRLEEEKSTVTYKAG